MFATRADLVAIMIQCQYQSTEEGGDGYNDTIYTLKLKKVNMLTIAIKRS